MILKFYKYILNKNLLILKNTYNIKFIYINIKYNIILDILILSKQLTYIYILCYNQFLLKNQILFINNLNILNNNLKITNLLTYSPYINTKIKGILSNLNILKKQILLLKWLVYLINLIHKNKIIISFTNIIKLYKLFIKLKYNYWNIINLKIPIYIFILFKNININIINEYINFSKQVFFITTSNVLLTYKKQLFIIYNVNNICIKLILELINTSYIQSQFIYY